MTAAGAIFESLVISVCALALNAVALAAGLLLFVGAEERGRHAGFAMLLLVLAALAVFGTALGALRRGPIDSPARGLRLGLLAAGVFYALILILFGLIPALGPLRAGDVGIAAGYLADIAGIALEGSYGLPLVTGALGGALYGWLRGRAARA